jgi:cobalt-zinc-cadmium efflux system outer membrane protein
MSIDRNTILLSLATIAIIACVSYGSRAQAPTPVSTPSRYIDEVNGISSDRAVQLALENNGELQALRTEIDAARAMTRQAGLRANPKLDASGSQQINGSDNGQMAELMVPLELGGRRGARIAVAQRELQARQFELANQERLLAANVRLKYGEAIADIKKLDLTEKTLSAAKEGYSLVAARVTEGKIAPLEQNVFIVEVNRLQALRETAEGRVQKAMFELRNMMNMAPEAPLRLKDELSNLIAPLPSLAEATDQALQQRPDLEGARSLEQLAGAKIEQAKSEGRVDASVKGGYQRNDMGFPVSGFDPNGVLRPVHSVFEYFTFGVELDLPVRNRNQGAIEAAVFEREAARRRIEFGALTVRREVASAFTDYDHAARALSIMQNGVRDQANANLQVIWQTYELGSTTLLDYIAEERRYLDVEVALVDAELETYNAKVDVLRSTNAPELIK